jgi:hypothetical protein
MVATAAHLTDHFVSGLPVWQWVLSAPKRLRYFPERDSDLPAPEYKFDQRITC